MVEMHVVTGKGGVGKTTTAAGLAGALAGRGARVLLAEVEGRFLPDLPGVTTMHVDARESLSEYIARHLRLGLATRALDRTGLAELAASIAPGLRDVLLVGALYARRGEFDAIVLDAPPTGRIGTFLGATRALGDAARVGPVHEQAARIDRWLRSDAVVVHLVTLPAEMPVTETLEAAADLRGRGLRLGHVVVNRVPPRPPAGDDEALPPAARSFVDDARARRRAADEWIGRLRDLDLPGLFVADDGRAEARWGALA